MLDLISCRESVKEALQGAGWARLKGPARFDGETLAILDFEAERENVHGYFIVLCADEVGRIPDITRTIGRYLVYREVIHKAQPEAVLYLAMPEDVHKRVVTTDVEAVIWAHGIEAFTANAEQRPLSGQALAQRVGQVVRSFSGAWTGSHGKAVSFLYRENTSEHVYCNCIIAPVTVSRKKPELIFMLRVTDEQIMLDMDKSGGWLRASLQEAGVSARIVQSM